ncbi:O-linked N-acetylglucosamine transferase, SPINDLY family protein [Phaeobacter gallaeciensis]|uniref:protein O-GlcNAc transferase n=1 Tax=Phaeobacter gallaeciensis TaxID=60890 RepID=A0AAD0ECR1_9RHOB|nr:O-linked N-acetylglucosamine transferase [Phaeobacter gallaeciensis]AHD09352.1 putative O-linked N-acetylglucosamine transferase, SPINDLY family [Phaeobacter gallaeciensis DSM 26640]ATE92615.1 putative O-linked N-acetylglucosamine transferase, SPINDLY family [Phaeobacter gallaeciensis]ATE97563.1 putative O-linked N-acetylglucosamine transferase, SPINDLY family [Phaeobacter gallaeciensis]ATF01280.1 putative O-linked N-acetylglucosamine transferase, SPINDLY family [Phaeobacter gallaeciensis]A
MNKPLRTKHLSNSARRKLEAEMQSPAVSLKAEAGQAFIEGDYQRARELTTQALVFEPDNATLHAEIASSFMQEKKYELALKHLMGALKLEPTNPKWLSAIGTILFLMDKLADAVGFFEAVYQLDPENAMNVSRLVQSQMNLCDWTVYEDQKNKLRILDNDPANGDPFTTLLYVDDAAFQKKRVVMKTKKKATISARKVARKFDRTPVSDRKIRVGYFSCDFFNHATMFLMARHFELHDRDKFEIYIYDYSEEPDNVMRQRVLRSADFYRKIQGVKDEDVAELARADGLDIAIDLKGYTKHARPAIFGFRAAPVQISYLGYPGTTGMPTMDYFLADPITVPKEGRRHFSEKILYMPNCYQVNDNSREHPENRPTRADMGLPEEAVVFCAFNNHNKVTPVEFDIWMDLLKQVDNSVLWFLAAADVVRANILKEAAARGVPADRIVFAGRCSTPDHVARLPLADIFLDTFACNAHTTASEMLWSGVPVVTKPGEQFAARVAASIVTAVGCPELIAETDEAYRALALRLATRPEELKALREKLAANISTTPLYDTEQYVRDFEALMEKAILRYDDGLKPDHLSLADGKV